MNINILIRYNLIKFFNSFKNKQNKPMISIIVPVYNTEKYVEQCINSLINQTYKNIEIIVVNDKSKDNSLNIVKKLKQKDMRIHIYNHKTNKGLSAARNTGIIHASGKYIMFCDSDDFYNENMCEFLYNEISKSNVNWGVCGTNIIVEDNLYQRSYAEEPYFSIQFKGIINIDITNLTKINCCAWNKIIKRNFLIRNNIFFPENCYHEDEFFFLACVLNDPTILCMKENLYNYRVRKNSIMYNFFYKKDELHKSSLNVIKIAERIFNYSKKYNLIHQRRNLELTFYYFFLLINISLQRAHHDKRKELIEHIKNFMEKENFEKFFLKNSFIQSLYTKNFAIYLK